MMHLFKPKGKRCICCCFCDVCPWAVFLLLHILFSTEQIQDFLHNLCLQVGNCNICCCFYFCIVCPWAVFILLHILFSAEQVFVHLYLCLQGCYVFVHVFPFYQIFTLKHMYPITKRYGYYLFLDFELP